MHLQGTVAPSGRNLDIGVSDQIDLKLLLESRVLFLPLSHGFRNACR